MSGFCVLVLANGRAIRCYPRLEPEHFALTAMDGGNAKGLPGAILADRHGWRECERIAGAILAQRIPPRINQSFLKPVQRRWYASLAMRLTYTATGIVSPNISRD